MQARQHDWFQYQSGALDEKVWAAYRAPVQVTLSSSNARMWWKYARSAYDPGLAEYIDSILVDFTKVIFIRFD